MMERKVWDEILRVSFRISVRGHTAMIFFFFFPPLRREIHQIPCIPRSKLLNLRNLRLFDRERPLWISVAPYFAILFPRLCTYLWRAEFLISSFLSLSLSHHIGVEKSKSETGESPRIWADIIAARSMYWGFIIAVCSLHLPLPLPLLDFFFFFQLPLTHFLFLLSFSLFFYFIIRILPTSKQSRNENMDISLSSLF